MSRYAADVSIQIQSEAESFQEVTQNVRALVGRKRVTQITTVSFASVEAPDSGQLLVTAPGAN